MEKLLILKLGGSVVTDKRSETPRVNYENLRRLAEELSAYKKPLILIHGAGSYGHQIVKRTGIHKGIEKEEQVIAFAETQRLQNELNSIVCQELIKRNIPAIPCQASASAIMEQGRLKSMDIKAIKGFLKVGMIPVLYGVPAYDRKQKCSILSGDQIAPYLAAKLKVKKIIHGTNVDGVFTADPNKNPNAKLISKITKENLEEVKKALSESAVVDVTGGMMGKVTELLHLAEEGVESTLVNAEVPGRLRDALMGKEVLGTTILRT
ncbi:MAG: isopentenyl phosphate kinase [Candidatus Micrarchaeota archaeon]